MQKKILAKDFLNQNLDSLTFYEILPSDGVTVMPSDGGRESASDLASRLMQAPIDELSISDLDNLSICLMNSCESFGDFFNWQSLADKMAMQYSMLILNTEKRELRMKLSRMNYFIRAVLDKNIQIEFISEWYIQAKGPWDFIKFNEQLLWIDCGEKNFKIQNRDSTSSYVCGLPTQIDMITETEIGIGSHYSNGGWIFDGKGLNEIEHSKPIVLFFSWNGSTFGLDVSGAILEVGKGVVDLIDLPFSMIHKCRLFGNSLIFFDWSQPKVGYIYQLDMGKGKCFNLDPVIICNDVYFLHGCYYLIDKEQGYLFKFSSDFEFIEKKSGLGHGKGRLYDPISIRGLGSELHVLNWFSGKIVNFKIF